MAEHDARRKIRTADLLARVPFLADLPAVEVDWLIEGLLPRNAVVIMAGSFGSYKSTLARDMAISVASGQDFAGHTVLGARPVLYLDRENYVGLIGLRVRQVLKARGLNAAKFPSPFWYWSTDMESGELRMPTLGGDFLLEWAQEHGGLIVFDSMVRFHRAKESDNTEMAAVMAKFTQLARAGATCLILHHRGKAKDAQYRGAEDIIAAADMGYAIRRNPEDRATGEGKRTVALDAIKNRFAQEGEKRYLLGTNGVWERAAGGDDDDGLIYQTEQLEGF